MLYVKYGMNRLQRRSRLKMLTDGRRMPAYPISSPMSIRLRWAKNQRSPCGMCMIPTVSPDTISPVRSVLILYDLRAAMKGNRVVMKPLQQLGEGENLDIFFRVLSCMVDVGRRPGSNWSSKVFWVNTSLSTTILGLPGSIKDSFSSSDLPVIKLYLNRNMTKPTKWVCAQRRLRSAWAPAKSDQSLRCVLNG